MHFRLLGPLEVDADGLPVSLGGARARALLALLLVHRNEVVPLDKIVDELWTEPPKTAEQVVRVYVSNLRKALEPPQVILTRGSGYLLQVGADDVDVDRFDALRTEGHRLLAAGEVAQAAETLGEALALWRGAPLQDFAYERFAQSEIGRLEGLRLATLEDLFDARLASGQDSELVADLEQLVGTNPLRERLRAQLMLALYRSGRQADALEVYQRGRRHLVDELGLEPSESLRRLEARILQQDHELDRPAAMLSPKESAPPPRSRRLAAAGSAAFVAAAAVTGVLVATTGHSAGRPAAASLRVALVVNESRSQSVRDTSRQGIDPIDGLHAAAEEVGIQTRILYGSSAQSRFLKTVAVAARTFDLVIPEAIPDLEALSRLTRRFPDTRFFVPDTVSDPLASFRGQQNVTGANFDDRENGYLGGYLAGLMTRGRDAVSAVGGVRRVQSVRELIAGFKAGARRARPGIRVFVDYSNTFKEQSPCERLANRQIDRGSAVVFDAAGSCGFGAMAAAGIRGVWGLGVDSDMQFVNSQILASVVKHFDRATQQAVTLFAAGRLPGGRDLLLDLSSGSIGLVGINSRVPQAVRVKVEKVAAELRARDQSRNSG
ncbi:MAG TPA: BTAD domain-containing putative transcriptional regulator [Gaiellaceae bacterium]|nr:BTAD domain-containing putative transcriptional regulator [Gaiellaceae bacterium]